MSKKGSVKPLLTLNDIVGEDINIVYSNVKMTEEGNDYLQLIDNEESGMLISNYKTFDSSIAFGIIPIKHLFHILYEIRDLTFEVVRINYSNAYSPSCTSATLKLTFKNNVVAYLGLKHLRDVQSGIPDQYKPWISNDKKLYVITYTTLTYRASDVEVWYSIANAIRSTVLAKGMAEFEKPTVEVITVNANGLDVRDVEIQGNKMTEESMDLHYGSDFSAFNKALLEEMGEKNKGVVLLHGPPGNGKTYYIRHLVSELRERDKRVIIVPKHVLAEMESPQFNDFMIDEFSGDNTKAVFVIEDAESVLRARDSDGDGRAVVSTILNLSDGILNDVFKVQLICTFNTDLDNIDSALLRKGRLLAKREFLPLDKASAQKLIEHLGSDSKAEGEMSLADIYATDSQEKNEILTGQKKMKRRNPPLGFHTKEWLIKEGYLDSE